eukprot:1898801-Pleurochrysis_carterae.AAC.2
MKGLVQGRNGSYQRHEFERCDAVSAARVRREGKGEEETVAVAPQPQDIAVLIRFGCIHGNKQGRRGARLARGLGYGRGNGEERHAIVV